LVAIKAKYLCFILVSVTDAVGKVVPVFNNEILRHEDVWERGYKDLSILDFSIS
jgi:hypothetical protein